MTDAADFASPVPARDRFRGCLLGGAVGDALGAAVEFTPLAQIRARFGPEGLRDYAPVYGRPGAITDDTQMTLFTAEGLLRRHVRWLGKGIAPPPEAMLARAYGRWLQTQGLPWRGGDCAADSSWLYALPDLHARRAPGSTCLAALQAIDDASDASLVARNASKGCGGVMRVAPVGLLFARPGRPGAVQLRHAFDLGGAAAALTHGHASGQLPAAVLAALIALVASGQALAAALEPVMRLLAARPGHGETARAVATAIELAGSAVGSDAAIARLGGGWIAEEALAVSVFCALRADTFADAVVLAVNHDGDSDSTGAITGNLAGAAQGVGAIPSRWLDALELRAAIATVADDLFDAPAWAEPAQSPAHAQAMARYPGD
jgi:ADP-ribosyl-[dinitrogen reductase] hydrolase